MNAKDVALQFYANPENWQEQETGIGMAPSPADMDGGSKAREALDVCGLGFGASKPDVQVGPFRITWDPAVMPVDRVRIGLTEPPPSCCDAGGDSVLTITFPWFIPKGAK